ncbi:PREDICTED: amyloid protein-binding protein 2 isoform X1 [Polistes canadensis]|uniref:amyloid protein-binding protein 2 isoform X1 n=2 Tax=Polistes canadensis TaxID=91411 RepID=UPI000718E246|nr:PREDICTED: amyloid protein-binding protein 2 isoform X1 [Polistes canadensis]XP_014608817.1 PREDICTED: amyloid protein-binding protein 2 isoform X1 [Polistes canadensis]
MAEGRKKLVQSTKTLYKLSVSAIADRLLIYRKHLVYLPENVLFDLYYQLYQERRLCLLGVEFGELETFSRMLNVTNRRVHLLQSFQALMDHGTMVGKELAIGYDICCIRAEEHIEAHDKVISVGLRLGGFLSDAGWYTESERVLLACKKLSIVDEPTLENLCRTLKCCCKLLHAQAAYYTFHGAAETYELALNIIQQLRCGGYTDNNYAALYGEFSVLFFIRSEYDEAYKWGIKALKQLKPSLPPRVIIDVLRQVAKSCVIKREFQKAGLLIRQAVYLAKEIFDTDHPKYSDVLIDYGFYLLNYDCIVNSVSVYKAALDIRKAIFGKTNLHVALAHEDLAYALYVREYNSGKFQKASDHAGKAIDIMEKLFAGDHIMLASAKRVKALILEEIALDNAPMPLSEQTLLQKSECLHLSALQLSKTTFGEINVQTAKHYGNLGRLYQSMRKFEEAEAMHLKSISIKEELLGPEDYEVGLSVGHLASLYNFHMNRYRDAEKLYYRSIAISLKLFGKSYSGLEYDYRGLLHVYTKLDERDKVLKYTDIFNQWKELRDKYAQSEDQPIDLQKRPQPIEEVVSTFFSM